MVVAVVVVVVLVLVEHGPERRVVEEPRERIRDWLCLIMVAHCSEIPPARVPPAHSSISPRQKILVFLPRRYAHKGTFVQMVVSGYANKLRNRHWQWMPER